MLSRKRLFSLMDTYGANPLLWPEAERSRAAEVLRTSEPARVRLEAARSLDNSIRDAFRMADAQLWAAGDQAAAVARVRSVVGAVISAPNHKRQGAADRTWFRLAGRFAARAVRAQDLGLAVGYSLAIVVGLFVGSAYVADSTSRNVIAIFQPALLHVVTD